jgi:hypothetical protein
MSDQVLKVLQQPPFQIYELLTAAQGTLQVEAIDAGGGGGGVALTSALFVDPGTSVAPADQTGAATAPFSTIAAAVAALPDVVGGAILLAPGSYPGAALDGSGKAITFIGLAGPQNDSTRAAAVVNAQGVNISSDAQVNLVNVQWGGVDLTVDPETPQTFLASGCLLSGGCFFDSARLVDCNTVDLAGSGPVFLDRCTVAGTIVCAGEPTWNNSSVSGDVTCEDLICNECTLGGSVTNAALFDPLSFNRTSVGSIVSLAPVTMLNGSICSGECTCVGLTIRDSSITGDVTCTGDLSSSDATFGGALTCNRILRAADTSFQTVDCTQAAFSHLRGCTYSSITGVAGANLEADSYSLGSGPPTTFDSVTLTRPFADLVVNVPVLADNAEGSVAVSTVGSGLDGLATSDNVVSQEPTAGIAGGGLLAALRINAANSITFRFEGPTSGGNQTFRVVRV